MVDRVVQNGQNSKRKAWATRSFVRSAHPLSRSIMLICLLAGSFPHSQACGNVNDSMSEIDLVLYYGGRVLQEGESCLSTEESAKRGLHLNALHFQYSRLVSFLLFLLTLGRFYSAYWTHPPRAICLSLSAICFGLSVSSFFVCRLSY